MGNKGEVLRLYGIAGGEPNPESGNLKVVRNAAGRS